MRKALFPLILVVMGLAAVGCTKSPEEVCEKKQSIAPNDKQSKDDCVFGMEMMKNMDKKKYEAFASCVNKAGDKSAYNDCVTASK